MFIYHPFVDSCLFGNNIYHSMLDFHKENNVLIKNTWKGILSTAMLASLVIHKFFIWCIYRRYSQHETSASTYTFGAIFYSTNMTEISDISISINVSILQLIYIIRGRKIYNIQCYIILSTKIFQLTSITKKYCRHLCYKNGYLSPVHWLFFICE